MTQEITAYLSDDGRIFRNRKDAQFADHMGALGARIAAFTSDPARSLPSDPAELLLAYEDWRFGGRAGWEAAHQSMYPLQAALPLEATPAPDAPAEAPVVPAPVTVPVAVPAPRAKPGPKPKPATAIMAALDAARSVAEARPAARAAQAYRKHVAIVGLFNIHHANIEREFGAALKLSIFDADCMARLHGLRACHKVIVMTKFVSHKHIEALKAIGQEPLMVNGGMDKLKEALTTIYVNT